MAVEQRLIDLMNLSVASLKVIAKEKDIHVPAGATKGDLIGQSILWLLQRGESLEIVDVPGLAGALFGGRDEAKLERVFEIVQYLLRAGKVTLEGGSALQVGPIA